MQIIAQFIQDLFLTREQDFAAKALQAMRWQYLNNTVYREFLQLLDISPDEIKGADSIPCLPVELFKTRKVFSGDQLPAFYFESSGTSGQLLSRHYIADLKIYEESILRGFRLAFGEPDKYSILALLPSYLEREHASLVYMAKTLMKNSKKKSGFYLNNLEDLKHQIELNEKNNITTLLMGVSFALLEFTEKMPLQLKNTIVMETGGMKGRRKEITRDELHTELKSAFGVDRIYSEYGMTELLSQAYSTGDGIFNCPPWMKVFIRDPEDPFSILPVGATGCINIIDLANIHSCCFIATQDLGKINPDGSFEVLGRYDNSDVRGCNLLLIENI